MTLLYSPSIRQLTVGKILQVGLANPTGITVYSGVQPTAAEITASWASYNSAAANYLGTFFGAVWTHPLSGTATFAAITTFPPAIAPTRAGTGAWCIIWPVNPSGAQLASTTIPNGLFIVAPVTNLNGQGVIRFSGDTVFTVGSNKAIADGVFGIALA